MIESVHVTTVKLTYSLITLLIITEYSDSTRVWKVGGVWNTTQRAELTERMKILYLQERTHLRQQLREMTRQRDAVMQRNEQELERNAKTIQQKEATIRSYAQALQHNEATIHQLQSDIREKDNSIEQSLLQIQQKNDVIQRHEGTITQQRRVITSYHDNPSRLIEGDVTGEESKEAMVIQLNQSRELAEGVTVILV